MFGTKLKTVKAEQGKSKNIFVSTYPGTWLDKGFDIDTTHAFNFSKKGASTASVPYLERLGSRFLNPWAAISDLI